MQMKNTGENCIRHADTLSGDDTAVEMWTFTGFDGWTN